MISPQLIGERLRAARQRRGLSLRALGELTGFSASFHSQVELGQASPSVGSLQRIVVPVNIALTQSPANPFGRTAVTTFELHTYVARTAPPTTPGGM